jgi:hypothetical protein
VIGEDRIGPDRGGSQESIRLVALRIHTDGHSGIDAIGQALQTPLPQEVAHSVLGKALLPPEVSCELLDREDPV